MTVDETIETLCGQKMTIGYAIKKGSEYIFKFVPYDESESNEETLLEFLKY